MRRKTRLGYEDEQPSYTRQKFIEKYLPEKLREKYKQPTSPEATAVLVLAGMVFVFIVCCAPILILVRYFFLQ